MVRAGAAKRPSRPLLEWLAAAVGAVLVAGSIGYMAYRAVAGEEAVPDLVGRVLAVHPVSGGFLVQVEVRNRGAETVAALGVAAELRDGGRSIELAQLTFDYVPAHSTRTGGVFFRNDPRRARVLIRPLGYVEP